MEGIFIWLDPVIDEIERARWFQDTDLDDSLRRKYGETD